MERARVYPPLRIAVGTPRRSASGPPIPLVSQSALSTKTSMVVVYPPYGGHGSLRGQQSGGRTCGHGSTRVSRRRREEWAAETYLYDGLGPQRPSDRATGNRISPAARISAHWRITINVSCHLVVLLRGAAFWKVECEGISIALSKMLHVELVE